jgi:hypothetical protein
MICRASLCSVETGLDRNVHLIAERCLELDAADPYAAARVLRTGTFFGAFELDPASGLQIGHRLSVVRWHAGRQELLLPNAA